MKYLIVSDIHGSLPALEKVLEHYERWGCEMLCLLVAIGLAIKKSISMRSFADVLELLLKK